ncbi:MAG: hypothetical protein JWO97_392 [Acidobacteria bacterium]|nr:hypothetical protein [Acidobacteriota bacterium]
MNDQFADGKPAPSIYENLDSAIQHEFGHAPGIESMGAQGKMQANLLGYGTNEQAVHAENKARAAYIKQAETHFGRNRVAARAAHLVYRARNTHAPTPD